VPAGEGGEMNIDNMMLRRKIVELALEEVGVMESGGNNKGGRIVEYQRATWLAPDAWPWCAAFTAFVLREAIKTTGNKIVTPCLDASAFGWEKWGRTKKAQILDEQSLACAGDFVIYDFSHIGIVVKDQSPNESTITTVEGNTSGRGLRDSESGDGVWRKIRATSLVKCYVRI
jgi:hypothetical protein